MVIGYGKYANWFNPQNRPSGTNEKTIFAAAIAVRHAIISVVPRLSDIPVNSLQSVFFKQLYLLYGLLSNKPNKLYQIKTGHKKRPEGLEALSDSERNQDYIPLAAKTTYTVLIIILISFNIRKL